jgi:hypothetical protein
LLTDFFPGLLYTDALQIRVSRVNTRFPGSRFLEQVAGGKAIGIELMGDLPSPDAFTGRNGWAWFLAGAQPASAARDEALRKLYDDPHIVSLTAKQ